MSGWTRGAWTVGAAGTAPAGSEPAFPRGRDRPSVCRSLGSWPELEAIERFRGAVRPHADVTQQLLASPERFTLGEAFPGG
jgi:hypothetical protein